MSNTVYEPIPIELRGGILDGDKLTMYPNGSVMPPLRLSYPWSTKLASGDEVPCWLNYETKSVPHWTDKLIIYVFSGKTPMESDNG